MSADSSNDDSLYPIAVLIDEVIQFILLSAASWLRNKDNIGMGSSNYPAFKLLIYDPKLRDLTLGRLGKE